MTEGAPDLDDYEGPPSVDSFVTHWWFPRTDGLWDLAAEADPWMVEALDAMAYPEVIDGWGVPYFSLTSSPDEDAFQLLFGPVGELSNYKTLSMDCENLWYQNINHADPEVAQLFGVSGQFKVFMACLYEVGGLVPAGFTNDVVAALTVARVPTPYGAGAVSVDYTPLYIAGAVVLVGGVLLLANRK